MGASNVPGSWCFFLYMSALCGCSNVYRCYWLPRWLRRLSIVYQIFMLLIYIIITGVALADRGHSLSFSSAFNRYTELFFYTIMVLSNIVILWQTYCGSGSFLLFQTRKTFQADNSYAVMHQIWRDVITYVVCLLVMILVFILIGISTWFTIDKQNFIAAYIFPVLNGHTTQKFMFGMYVMIQVSSMTFPCYYMLLCFVVLVDITLLFRTLREEMDVVFCGLVVDGAAVERCLQTIRGICELVDATNSTFGIPLALYLMWIVPTIINIDLQLFLDQELDFIVYLLMSVYAVMILVLILVPPAVMTAQVNTLRSGKSYTHDIFKSLSNYSWHYKENMIYCGFWLIQCLHIAFETKPCTILSNLI